MSLATASSPNWIKSKRLRISGTDISPSVDLDWNERVLHIRGASEYVGIGDFYATLIDMVVAVAEHSRGISMFFEYSSMDITTVRCLFKLFSAVQRLQEEGSQVMIGWIVCDERSYIRQNAQDFAELYDLDFEIMIK